MKQCPQCRQSYSDETLFCLSDGTPLISINDAPEELTVIKPLREEVTVVRTSQNIQPTIETAQTGVNPIFAYLAGGLFLLVLGIGVIGIGLLALNRSSKHDIPNTQIPNSNLSLNHDEQDKINREKANLKVQQDQIEREKQRLADERKKIEQEKNRPAETPLPTLPSTTPYPPQPTARIKFGRGRVAESVSGKIYTQRSFVLEARSGQYLSANVSSGGGCVVFSNGGTSLGYITSSGDNRVTLVNNCNSEAGFNLTVAIR